MIDPRTGEYAVIAPGHNFRSVTQKIAGIVLTPNTPWAWFGGLFLAGTIALVRKSRGGRLCRFKDPDSRSNDSGY